MATLRQGDALVERCGGSGLQKQARSTGAESRAGDAGDAEVPQPIRAGQVVHVQAEAGLAAPVWCYMREGACDILGNAFLDLRVGPQHRGREAPGPAACVAKVKKIDGRKVPIPAGNRVILS